MEQKISSKSTKNEILSAYEDMLKKVNETKIEEPKKIQEEKKNSEIIAEVSKHNGDSIMESIASLKISMGKELDKISDILVTKNLEFEQIQKAIQFEKNNLKDLYNISAEADSLAALIMAQNNKKETFEKEISDKQQAFDEQMKSQKDTLEHEISAKKEAWDLEKTKKEQEIKDFKTATEKERTRENEEYTYNLNLKRKKETDQYEEKKNLQEKELKEKKIAFEKEITEREQNIEKSENELKNLRLKVEGFPNELTNAIASAEKTLKEKLETQYHFDIEITAKQTEGELKLKEQTIESLKNKIKEQEQYIKELTERVGNADKSVKDIAVKAIESSAKLQFIEKRTEQSKE